MAAPVQDFFIERVRHKHDLSSAAGKSAAVEEAMPIIGQIPDPVQQAHYVQRLSSLVGVDEKILLQQLRRPGARSGITRRPGGDPASGIRTRLLEHPAVKPRLRSIMVMLPISSWTLRHTAWPFS